MRQTLSALLILISLQATAWANQRPQLSVDDHIRGGGGSDLSLVTGLSVSIPSTTTAGTFQQVIDHTNPGATFSQRYWQNSSFAQDARTAPVILHICGEADCTDGYFLNDSALDWAKALGAHVVYLEHRYYGESLPYKDMSNEHMSALSLNNVLEDLASFQKWISTQNGWQGKWIVVGGSYSGTISALYRQKHPELVVGALASSAPMISGIGTDESGDAYENSPGVNNDERSWSYQACTELGFWVANGPQAGAELYRPSAAFCEATFPGAQHFNKDDYNSKYDEPFLSNAADAPSNILFTYGSADVWTAIGLTTQTNANAKITIRMINGAVHHYDLNAATAMDSNDVKQARAQFLSLARTWLH